jgi:multidrug efflux pump subunit AcrA (membrane-fusion protein)
MTRTKFTGSRLSLAVATIAIAAILGLSCRKPNGAGTGGQQAWQGDANAQGGQVRPSGSGGPGGQSGQGGRRSAVIPVQAMTVKVDTLIAERSTAGVVNPAIQSQVATQVAGIVRRVTRNVGDWVKAGDVIAELEDAQLRISLSTAQLTLRNAQINVSSGQSNSDQAGPKLALQLQSAQSALDSANKFYESQKALFGLGGISAAQLDTAASQQATAQANLEAAKSALSQNQNAGDQSLAQLGLAVDQAQNTVDQARLNLQNASVRAPFAGQIAAIALQPGMYASLNTPVLTLVSAERKIAFNVSPIDAPFLGLGATVSFTSGGKKSAAKIQQAPSAPISGVVPMSAAPSGPQLAYGTVGTIDYRVPLAKGALVPIASLSTLESQTYVFTVDSGRAAVRNVTIVAESGTLAAVDGLASGEVVIVNPPPGLLQGSQVQPTMIQAEAGSPAPSAIPQAAPGAMAKGAGGPSGTGGGRRFQRTASPSATASAAPQASAQ